MLVSRARAPTISGMVPWSPGPAEPSRRDAVPLVAGAAVGLIGAIVLAGWTLDLDIAKRLVFGQPTAKANTGLALAVMGGGLAALGPSARRRRIAVAAGLGVLALSLATLIEHVAGLDLSIDQRLVADPETVSGLSPGRMALATAVALAFAGGGLAVIALAARRAWAEPVARGLAGGVLGIGVLSLAGLFVQGLDIYTWYAFGAVPTSVALTILGLGLLAAVPASPRQRSEDQRIVRVATLALGIAAGATGIAGVAAVEWQVRQSVEAELQGLLRLALNELATNLDLRATRAGIVTTRPNMRHHLRLLVARPGDPDSRRVVQGVLESFLAHDFSTLAVTGTDGAEIARAGVAPTAAVLEVPLDASGSARLLWRDPGGAVLRHQLPMADAEGMLGTVLAEQRLGRVTSLLLENQTGFRSAELLLCRSAPPAFHCFPSRLSPRPVVVSEATNGSSRLVQRAVEHGAGLGITTDYRGERVVGAYGRLAGTELVAALKADVDEVYAPVRRQFALAIGLVVLVTVAGVLLIRARVGPLAARLEERVQQRTEALDRANARLRILHEIDQGLIAARSPGAIAEQTLPRVQDLAGVPWVLLIMFDLEAGQAEWLAGVGRRRVRLGPGIRYSLALAGDIEALKRGVPQLMRVRDLAASPEREALLASGIEVYVVVPMLAGGELVGGLSLCKEDGTFSADQIGIAQEVATQLAIALAQAGLHAQVKRQAEDLERRVDDRTRALTAANRQLEAEVIDRQRAEGDAARANRAKSEFLSRMSHELRTPLNGILGFAQLLELEGVAEEQRESVGQILRAGRHLLGLIDEVLDISRIEAGRLRLSLEPVAVGEAVQSAMDLVRPLAAERGIPVASAGIPAERYVLADRQRLVQVLLNLLSNAVKYNRPGGTVTVSCDPATGDRFRIRVKDTGVGIAADKLARLFVPFDRLDAEATGVEGTGLGLTLSKHLVESMSGTLEVESRVDHGSTFSIELPATRAPIEAQPRPWPEPHAGSGAPRAVVLYVEDNLANLRLVERIMARRPGIVLLSAMQGRIGVDIAREHRPDLVLLDQHLPDVDGDVVVRLLAADPRTRDIPVVMLSADASPGQIRALREAGVRDYLTKPIDVARLLALVDAIVAGPAPADPA